MFAKKVINYIYRRLLKKIKLLFSSRLNNNDILLGLKRLGVKYGDIIYVHSSLSSFGYIKGGVYTLIEALLESVGKDGTVSLPSFHLRGRMVETLSDDNYIFDPRNTSSTLGILPEKFRKMENALRSIHPTHSVCAIGKKAEWITKDHQFCKTTFGEGTPFHKLLSNNCLILLLGVDIQFPTFYHTFEDLNDSFPIKIYLKKDYKVKVLDYDGNEIKMKVKAQNPDIAKYRIDHEEGLTVRSLFREYYREQGILNETKIGKAKCYSMRCQDMYNAIKSLFEKKITIYNIKFEN